MVCVNAHATVHSPVWVNGVKFTRYFIDSRCEVNLISVKDAIRHGFVYELGEIKKSFRFNGSSNPVDGLMEWKIRRRPNGDIKKVEFLVTLNVTIPILGCLELTELGFMMDYKERILVDDQGNVVRCSPVHNRKN